MAVAALAEMAPVGRTIRFLIAVPAVHVALTTSFALSP
jgi:hypothetical protein